MLYQHIGRVHIVSQGVEGRGRLDEEGVGPGSFTGVRYFSKGEDETCNNMLIVSNGMLLFSIFFLEDESFLGVHLLG